MRRIELLAPAKNLEGGITAINYGADAVYIGAPRFGARAAVGNSLEDIGQLIQYAHKYWAKVFITMNTILYDNELKDAEKMIHQLYKMGADALIVQDMGILELDLPPIALHASTQTHNYDLDRIQFLEKAGFERIILARELSQQQIQEIRRNTSSELEYFVNGALCVCLSGQCYFSQAIGGRSANRGECAQPCRMKYQLEDKHGKVLAKDKHLLSLKDLNLADQLEDIIDSGIISLKIEGRLKDISYIKNVVSHYRKKLDEILEYRQNLTRASSGSTAINFTPDPERTFNRGFTSYFFNGRTQGIANFNSPKALGKQVGRIVSRQKDHFIFEGQEPLHNGDGLCYFNRNKLLKGMQVNGVKGNKIFPNEMGDLTEGAVLYRNHDHEFERQLKQDKAQRKISASLLMESNEKFFQLTAFDEDGIVKTIDLEGDFELAQNREMAANNLRRQLSKSGDSIFSVEEITLPEGELPFIPAKQINEIRRTLLNSLEEERINHHQQSQVRPLVVHPPYPDKHLSYSSNVSNYKAEEFYKKCGVESIAPAFELQSKNKGKTIMTTRHCLRYEFNMCPKKGKAPNRSNEPLYLVDNKNRYRLEFNCKRCEMKVILE
jgi:putative protease